MSLQLISQLNIPTAFISNLVSEPNKFYKQTERPKMKLGREQIDAHGSLRMRTTSAPIAFLKFVLRKVNNHLQMVELPNCMFGGVPGKNNIQNALQHIEANYFFTIDLKDFFSNISNKQVNRALRNNGFSWDDARIITKLCTLNRCLPQGAPTSSTLANIVFAPTAKVLEKFCIARNITFTTFVDDLTFSSKYDFSNYKNEILNIISKNGFYVHNNKIHYRHQSCEITGLIVKDQKLSLEEGMLSRKDNPKVKAYIDNVERHFIAHQQSRTVNRQI